MAGFGDIFTPIHNWVDPRRNALAGLGAGLLQGRPGTGVQEGIQADTAFAVMQKAEDERARNLNQTVEWARKTYPDQLANVPDNLVGDMAVNLWKQQFMPSSADNLTTDQRNWLMAQKDPAFAAFLNENGGGVEYGYTPQWYQNADGTFGYGVQGKDGSFKPVQPPDGATMLDPRSLNSEKAFGTATGKASGEATAAAPGDIAAGSAALDIINQIRTSPELPWATGTMAGLGGNAIPGTGRFGFQNLVEQAKSGAFLTAVQEMRGLGALSNAEGQAATQAITRINTALSKEDFLKALADYEAIVLRGMERAQARLNTNAPAANQGGGRVLTYNPATGNLE